MHYEHHSAGGVPGTAAQRDARRAAAHTPAGAGRGEAPGGPKGLGTEVGKR